MTTRGDGELRLADVTTFLAVVRTSSITSSARQLRVTPSQVSKAIARLERHVQRPLLLRRSRGVVLTEYGTHLIPQLEELVARARHLRAEESGELLTIACPSYLALTLLPAIAETMPDVRVRGIEIGDALIRAHAADGLFQVALTLSPQSLTRAWESTRLGSIEQAFFASQALSDKLGPQPSLERIGCVPSVMAVYFSNGQFVQGDDGCPIPRTDRRMGHEVQTVGVALELAAKTQQVAFGPEIAAREFVRTGRLVRLDVPGATRSVDVYLHVNATLIKSKVQTSLREALTRQIEGR